VSTATYAALFAVIGYTYGGSGGSFVLPDLRGEFIRGWDDGRGVDPARAFGSAQAENLPNHKHGVPFAYNSGNSDFFYTNTNPYGTGSNFTPKFAQGSGFSYTTTQPEMLSNVPYAPSTSTGLRPRNVALLPCIKI
jgi:microcystin-dependent protein